MVVDRTKAKIRARRGELLTLSMPQAPTEAVMELVRARLEKTKSLLKKPPIGGHR